MADAKQIRGRVSYMRFMNIATELKRTRRIDTILKLIYGMLEGYRAFGSHTASRAAAESIRQVVTDLKGGKPR